MPRLPEVLDRNALPEDKREIYDYLARTRGAVRLPFSAALAAPELTYRIAHLGSYLRFESTLSDRVRELAVLSASREVDARLEWAGHVRLAKQAGIEDSVIDLIGRRGPLDGLSAADALPVRAGRELLAGRRLEDETFASAHASFGAAGVVELIATVGYYALMGCLLNGLDIQPPADAARLP